MKKHVLLMSITALVFLGCSNIESEPIQEASLSLNYSKMIKELGSNKDFINYFKNNTRSTENAYSRSSNSNGNGVMFIQDGIDILWSFPVWNDNGTPDDPDDDFVEKVAIVGGKAADIKKFRDGTAMAQVSTNEAFCFVIDFSTFSFLGNDCYDIKGHFSLKISGTLIEDEAPWGTVYDIIPPSTSAFHIVANNIKVNNETITYDEETGEPLYCNGDATVEKSVSLKVIQDKNHNVRKVEVNIN